MNAYLIDFENVKSKGLTGIEHLGENDRVIIFYSENSDTISFDMHMKVMATPASVEYLKVRVGGKNALDFQLCSMMGFIAAKEIYRFIFIISNDKGFDKLHDFWNVCNVNNTSCTVFRSPTIKSAMLSKGLLRHGSVKQSVDEQTDEHDITEEQPEEQVIEPTEATANESFNQPTPQSETDIYSEDSADNSAADDSDLGETGENDETGHEPEMVITKIAADDRKHNTERVLAQIKNALLGSFDFEMSDVEEIMECIENSETKEDFHNSLAKVFKQNATELYKILRPKYLRLKAMLRNEEDGEQALAEAGEESVSDAVSANTEGSDSDGKDDNALMNEISRLLKSHCSQEEIETVCRLINETDTRQRLYLSIIKKYKKDRGCEIYKYIKPEYMNLIKLKTEVTV